MKYQTHLFAMTLILLFAGGVTLAQEHAHDHDHDHPASAASATDNVLTPEEEAAGWQLLFDGTLTGWHNFM